MSLIRVDTKIIKKNYWETEFKLLSESSFIMTNLVLFQESSDGSTHIIKKNFINHIDSKIEIT